MPKQCRGFSDRIPVISFYIKLLRKISVTEMSAVLKSKQISGTAVNFFKIFRNIEQNIKYQDDPIENPTLEEEDSHPHLLTGLD
jgi:hypothetical protein